MSRQDTNAAFALTSFLYGGNAGYVDDLYARYEADPKSVDAEWQAFFRSLKDDGAAKNVVKNGRGRSRARSPATGARPVARSPRGSRRAPSAAASRCPPPTCSRRPAIRSMP